MVLFYPQLGFAMEFEVCVQIALQTGSHPWRVQSPTTPPRLKVTISERTTFRQLRTELNVLLFAGDNSDEPFHRIEIQFASTFQRRPAHVAMLDDIVYFRLLRIESDCLLDDVKLVLTSMPRGRRNVPSTLPVRAPPSRFYGSTRFDSPHAAGFSPSSPPSSSSSSLSSLLPSSSSSSSSSCTEWIHDLSNTDHLYPPTSIAAGSTSGHSPHPSIYLALEHLNSIQGLIPEKILHDASCRSIKQGRLYKRSSSGPTEEWTEMCVILETSRLWFYPIVSVGNKARYANQLSSIVLEMSLPLSAANDAATIATAATTKAHFTDSSLSCTTFFITHPRPTPLSMGSSSVYFRAKTRIEAEKWVLAITAKAVHERENEEIIRADAMISKMEREASRGDIQVLSDNARYEGMLGNNILRGAFQSYLKTSHIPESLKFWEHAEDYRRGHPDSSEPFDFLMIDTGNRLDVQAWGMAIFDTFLRIDAQYQISDCSFEESKQILKILSAPHPPHNAFISVQANAYFKLKYADGHYPTFLTECPKYRKLLQASLHAHHRSVCNKPVFESFFGNNRLSMAEQGMSAQINDFGPKQIAGGGGTAWSRLKSLFGASSGNRPGVSEQMLHSGSSHASIRRSIEASTEGVRKPSNLRYTPWRTSRCVGGVASQNRSFSLDVSNLPNWWWKHACPGEDKDRASSILLTRGCLKTCRHCIPLDERNTDLLVLLDRKLQLAQEREAKCTAVTAAATALASPGDVAVPLTTLQGMGNILLASMVRARYFPYASDIARTSGNGGGSGGSDGGDVIEQAGVHTPHAGCTGGADPCTGSDWIQLYALVTQFIGLGAVVLIDPVSSTVRAKIHLHKVERVCATPRGLSCLDLWELSGRGGGSRLRWQIIPLAVDTEERHFSTQSWIDTLWPLTTHGNNSGGGVVVGKPTTPAPRSLPYPLVRSLVRIVACGILSKRGNINTAYKRRWFVCCSGDKILSYYKETTWKGSIDLSELIALKFLASEVTPTRRGSFVTFLSAGGGMCAQDQRMASPSAAGVNMAEIPGSECLATSSKEMMLITKGRTFFLMADSLEEAERWFTVLHECLQDILGAVTSSASIPMGDTSEPTLPSPLIDAPYHYINHDIALELEDRNVRYINHDIALELEDRNVLT